MGSSKKSLNRLYEVASEQQGFFTARQAKAAGYSDSVHAYHVRNGDWEKMHRGIYRLVHYPRAPWPELVTWWLWSRGRDDVPKGVYSHETALAIHGESAKRGKKLHMIVPPDFRRGIPIPRHIVLHPATLRKKEVLHRDGLAVTTLARARADTATSQPAEPAKPQQPIRQRTDEKPDASAAEPRGDWAVWE